MKKKLIILSLLVSVLSMAADNKKGLVASSKNHKNVEVNKNEDKKPQMGAPMNKKVITEDMITNKTENGYNLNFDVNKNYTTKTATVNGKTVTYRAYENIVYVAKPVDIAYQTINIYIPEEYFKNKSVGKYNAKSAPIFFPNTVGGYMPGAAGVPGNGRDGKPDASLVALSNGYVVASPGARGRTLEKDGKYTGKAPAVIVDLKAAVRYLRYNDTRMPGRADRIISNGTSAGGAVSALLGATGNNKDYEPYLKEIGALNARDDIYAVSAYCPITNLDNANTAYEWMFNDVKTYKKIEISMLDYNVERKYTEGTLNDDEISRSNDLKKMFPAYLNSLKLKGKNGKLLTLNENGNGSFKEQIKQYYIDSANTALKKGTDLSEFEFLTIKNGKVVDLDYDKYVAYMGRQKTPGAFDNVDLSTGENNEFGDETTNNKHFTEYMLEHSTVNGTMADKKIIKMMNPMNYIANSKVKYWRIRHGAVDKDTSLAIPAILAIKLENLGKKVDFASPWATPHSGDYDLDELFSWMDKVVAEGR